METAQLTSEDLVSAFVAALRRVISAESDVTRRLALAGEVRRQMSLALRLAPYQGEAETQEEARATLASSMEAAYFTVLQTEVLGPVPVGA